MAELGLIKPNANPDLVHTYRQGSVAGQANIHWFQTQAGPLVVDAPLTLADAQKLRKQLVRPYRIYITAADPSRFGALATLRQPDIPAFTTPTIASAIQAEGDQRLAALHARYGAEIPAHVEAPAGVIEDRTDDMIGGVEVIAIPLGGAKSGSALAIYLPKSGELIAGEFLANKEHLDLSGGHSQDWQQQIAVLKALSPRLVYPGRGGVGGPELLDETAAYLKFFHDAVARKVKSGGPARLGANDVAAVKRRIETQFPKLGHQERLDGSIAAEYAVQLADLSGGASSQGLAAATPEPVAETASSSADDLLGNRGPRKHKRK